VTGKLIKAIIAAVAAGGYVGIGGLMAISCACIPLPSEIVMLAAGWEAAKGELSFWWAVWWGTVGCLIGSLVAYWIGRYGGRPFLQRYRRYVLLSAHDLERADGWFTRYGDATVFVTRLMPIVRAFISLPAGVAGMPLLRFSIYTFLGSAIWCWGLAYLGYHTGRNWGTVEGWLHRFDAVILVLLTVGVIWWVRRHVRGGRREEGRREPAPAAPRGNREG